MDSQTIHLSQAVMFPSPAYFHIFPSSYPAILFTGTLTVMIITFVCDRSFGLFNKERNTTVDQKGEVYSAEIPTIYWTFFFGLYTVHIFLSAVCSLMTSNGPFFTV
jgi:hypothetical protein